MRNVKYIILIVFLYGCASVSNQEWESAKEICGDIGINTVTPSSNIIKVRCNNGVIYHVSQEILRNMP